MSKSTIVLLMLLTGASIANSQEQDDRVTQLEKEVKALNSRISSLEAMVRKSKATNIQGEGQTSLAGWRRLFQGMGPAEVKKLLGEPRRVRAGITTTWYYENDGRIEFLQGEVVGWNEPEK